MTASNASVKSSEVIWWKSRAMAAPRWLSRATLAGWSENSGIPTSGTAWYTASYRPLAPPCVTNARVFGWPVQRDKNQCLTKVELSTVTLRLGLSGLRRWMNECFSLGWSTWVSHKDVKFVLIYDLFLMRKHFFFFTEWVLEFKNLLYQF